VVRMRISLRVVFLFLYLIPVSGGMALISLLGYYGGQHEKEQLARQFLSMTATQVQQQTEQQVVAAQRVLALNHQQLEAGTVPWNDLPALERHFLAQTSLLQPRMLLGFASESGEYIASGQRGTVGQGKTEGEMGTILGERSQATQNLTRWFAVTAKGDRLGVIPEVFPADPRSYEWYKKAQQTDGEVWSVDTPGVTVGGVQTRGELEGVLVTEPTRSRLTLSQRVTYQGQSRGVVRLSFVLVDLLQLFQSWSRVPPLQVIVVGQEEQQIGAVLAQTQINLADRGSSSLDLTSTVAEQPLPLPPVEEVLASLSQDASFQRFLTETQGPDASWFGDLTGVFSVSPGRSSRSVEDYFVQVKRSAALSDLLAPRSQLSSWLVITVVPQKAELAPASGQAIPDWALSPPLVWGLVASGCFLLLNLWIFRQMMQAFASLQQSSQDLTEGKPASAHAGLLSSPIGELADFVQAFEKMVAQVNSQKVILAEEVTSKTAALMQSQSQLGRILETATACICHFQFRVDNSVECEYVSPRSLELFGYTPAEMMPRAEVWTSHIEPEDFQAVLLPSFAKIHAVKDKPLSQVLRYRFHHRDGSLRWILSYCWSQWSAVHQYWECTVVATDITEVEQLKLGLQQKGALFKSLFDQSQWGILFRAKAVEFRDQGFVNRRFCQLLGYSEADLLKIPYEQIVAAEDFDKIQRLLLAMETEGIKSGQVEVQLVRKDGQCFWTRLTFDQLQHIPGFPDFQVVFCEDIRDRKAAEVALQQAKEVAEAADRAKGLFIASMSHELRSPLNAILGFARLIQQDNRVPEPQRENAAIIDSSGEHLLHLINQILSLAKLENGPVALEPRAINLHKLVQEVQKLLQVKVKAKQLELQVEIQPEVPVYAVLDEMKLRQVLINLLDNAVKFTDRGQILLRVEFGPQPTEALGEAVWADKPQPEQPKRLFFTVQDTGMGIAPEEQPLLFQAFRQTRSGQAQAIGTGLGLAISAQLVQTMGGKITVESLRYHGSSFRFNLPWVQVSADQKQQVDARKIILNRKVIGLVDDQPVYRVLIVDDGPVNRRLLLHLLRVLPWEFREASDGQEAVEIWQTWQPQVIFMDLQMPIMDGFTAVRQIRSQEQQSGGDSFLNPVDSPLAVQANPLSAPSFTDSSGDGSTDDGTTTGNPSFGAAPHSTAEDQGAEDQDAGDRTSPQALERTLIIALSATDLSQEPEIWQAAGYDRYITKPFQLDVLFQTLQETLDLHYRYREV